MKLWLRCVLEECLRKSTRERAIRSHDLEQTFASLVSGAG